MTLRSIVAASVLALGTAGAANASTSNWLVHDYPAAEVGAALISGAFTDYYTFTLPTGFNLVAGVTVSNDNAPSLLITSGSFALYSNADGIVGNGDDSLVGGWWTYDGTTGATQRTASVGSGDYYYKVIGVGAGVQGQGLYTLTSRIAPVPEPETYALMLAGLGAIGFIARRRARR